MSPLKFSGFVTACTYAHTNILTIIVCVYKFFLTLPNTYFHLMTIWTDRIRTILGNPTLSSSLYSLSTHALSGTSHTHRHITYFTWHITQFNKLMRFHDISDKFFNVWRGLESSYVNIHVKWEDKISIVHKQ